MPKITAVGIDLGTTYSSVALVNDHGVPEIIPNAESERLTPSAVFFDEDAIVVGEFAKEALVTDPDRVVTFIKRQMGNANWHFDHALSRLAPSDISAMILAKLKRDAESYLNSPVPYAVITVPAYFDDVRRRATIAAGEVAGFEVLDLLNEPTAAAIAFGVTRSEGDERVLVYDLGGGTFDVTLMQVRGQEITILGTDGDHQLGGKDFDDLIMSYAARQFVEEHGFDPTEDPFIAGELRTNAENTKRQLSKRSKSVIMLRARGKTCRIELTRAKFEALIKPKLDTTLAVVRDVLRVAEISPTAVDRVLLIGGSTRILLVRKMLAEFFGTEPDSTVNPDEAVAMGAALIAAKRIAELRPTDTAPEIVEKVGGLQITDVTSHSFGIEAFVPGTQQRINSVLIPRNTPIPAEVSKEFVTTLPGQTAIRVTIYQGEFEDPALCNPVGEFTLGGLPPDRPPGRKVRITVSCANNGVVNVTALDLESGKKTTTEVSYRSGQTTEQVSAKQRWLASQAVL